MQKCSITKAVVCQNGHIFGAGPVVHIPAFCGPHIVHRCNTAKHGSLYIQRSITEDTLTTILPLANTSIHNSDNIHASALELSTHSHFYCIYAQQRNMLRTSDCRYATSNYCVKRLSGSSLFSTPLACTPLCSNGIQLSPIVRVLPLEPWPKFLTQPILRGFFFWP